MKIALRVSTLLLAGAASFGCGRNYAPPSLPTTGTPAGQLGQVLDVDVEFPDIDLFRSVLPGLRFGMRIEMERTGYGEIPARVFFEDVLSYSHEPVVLDLTNGQITVTVTPERWISGLIGPVSAGGRYFQFALDGVPSADGWHVSGRSIATQSAEIGAFEGWRRHRFLVAGTDFSSGAGRIEEIALVRETEIRVRHGLELVSSDPVLRVTNGALFAVNRLTFDNLQRIDPASGFRTSWQASVGAGANPQDVALPTAGKGYVTRFEPPFNDVAVFDPQNGSITAAIPLTAYADNPDGTPRASRLCSAAGAVFVTLQDIDRSFARFEEGKLVVLDPVLDEVAAVIPLGGKNPFAMQVLPAGPGGEKLYVSLAGIFPGLQAQELSGGVVIVDAAERRVERFALDDDVAGGNVSGLAVAGEELGYVVVSDESFVNRVKAFDPARGVVLRVVRESTELIPEIAIDTQKLLAVPDRNFFGPGLCLYRTPRTPGDAETLVGCGATELPPFSLVALD